MDTLKEAKALVGQSNNIQPQQSTVLATDEVEESSQQGLNFRPLLRVFKRNALFIAAVTTAATGVAYWLSISTPPSYEGSFRLLVEPITPEENLADPGAVARGEQRPQQNELDYATQIELLKSSNILDDIAQRVQNEHRSFNAEALRKRLTVERCCRSGEIGGGNKDTKLLEVIYQGYEPDKVNLILDVAANRFLQYSLEDRKSSISEGVRFIDNQLPELENRVSTLQQQIQDLQQRYFITDPQNNGNQITAQLTANSEQIAETQRLLQEQRTLYQELQQQLDLSPDAAIAASTLSENPGYQELLRQREQVESLIATESSQFREASPRIQSLRRQQQELLDLQKERAREVLGANASEVDTNSPSFSYQNSVRIGLINQMVQAQAQIRVLQARFDALNRTRQDLAQRAQQFPSISRRYTELQRQLDLATQTLDQLLGQRETLRVEAAQNEFPWEIVSMSEVPRDPNGEPIPMEGELQRNMAMGMFLGGFLGAALALLREKLRDEFFTPEDIDDALSLPILTSLPYVANPVVSKVSLRWPSEDHASHQLIDEQEYDFSKAFETLFTKINFLYGQSRIKSIAVISAASHDGKTTTAFNLALTAIQANQKVLVVDANFQDPQLHQLLSCSNQSGLSDILVKDVAYRDLIQQADFNQNLFVLPAGGSLQRASGLLASQSMRDLVNKLQSEFDLIIYDTHGLQASSDTSFLSSYVDGSVLVTALKQSKRSWVVESLQELQEFNLPILGVVANYTESA